LRTIPSAIFFGISSSTGRPINVSYGVFIVKGIRDKGESTDSIACDSSKALDHASGGILRVMIATSTAHSLWPGLFSLNRRTENFSAR
jgi:hypothetical protein